jgi:hypothetical protein
MVHLKQENLLGSIGRIEEVYFLSIIFYEFTNPAFGRNGDASSVFVYSSGRSWCCDIWFTDRDNEQSCLFGYVASGADSTCSARWLLWNLLLYFYKNCWFSLQVEVFCKPNWWNSSLFCLLVQSVWFLSSNSNGIVSFPTVDVCILLSSTSGYINPIGEDAFGPICLLFSLFKLKWNWLFLCTGRCLWWNCIKLPYTLVAHHFVCSN